MNSPMQSWRTCSSAFTQTTSCDSRTLPTCLRASRTSAAAAASELISSHSSSSDRFRLILQ
jgi:hypothetical protein